MPTPLLAPSLRIRMACWLYEGLLLFGVIFLPAYLFATLSQTRHALENRHLFQGFMFVVLGIYFVWFWAKGQTLAMKTWRIKLVDAQGKPVSQKRALLRYTLSWIWFIPPLTLVFLLQLPVKMLFTIPLGWVVVWAVLSRLQAQRQFWHDIWAGTRLVKTSA
jgi:uncharacterized RDD family membrane protein YckC